MAASFRFGRITLSVGAVSLGLLPALATGPVAAADIELGGLIFSDEDPGIVLHEGWGNGTAQDPFTLVEDILDAEAAVLTIRGMDRYARAHARQRRDQATTPGRGDQGIPPGRRAGFHLVKIVRNLSGRAWPIFELELRQDRNRPSGYHDGLSFAQARGDRRVLRSDRFPEARHSDEPLDAVTFSGATIRPGERVQVGVHITDFSPVAEFHLIQRRQSPTSQLKREGPPQGGPSVSTAVIRPVHRSQGSGGYGDYARSEGCSAAGETCRDRTTAVFSLDIGSPPFRWWHTGSQRVAETVICQVKAESRADRLSKP